MNTCYQIGQRVNCHILSRFTLISYQVFQEIILEPGDFRTLEKRELERERERERESVSKQVQGERESQ